MPTIQDSGAILTSIGQDLADNNAGLISAQDVRHNMEDTVASIPNIVSLSDTENTYYFRNNVKVSGDGSVSRFITEGGIQFPNSPVDYHPLVPNNIQTEPYPGSGKLDHNLLTNRIGDSNDCHPQYLLEVGGPTGGMRGNLRMRQGTESHWIGPSGLDDQGIQFAYDSDEKVVVNTNGRIVYADNSTSQDVYGSGTAKGVAKAWCNFDASGTPAALPAIRSSYNIDSVERVSKGVIKITFASGIFGDNNYVAIGNSNANTGSGTFDAFDINTVGLMLREGDDATALRSIHYVIRSDDNDLVDAELNDFVAYGLGPITIADPPPTVS
jgi:hypothetical protein